MLNRFVVLLTFLVIFLWLPATGEASPPAERDNPRQDGAAFALLRSVSPVGGVLPQEAESRTEDCRACHEDTLSLMDRTYHGGLADECYSCHAGAQEHMEGQMEGENPPGPSIQNMAAEDANAVCQSCHETSHNPAWEGGAHQRRGVKCIDCHSVHAFKSEKSQLKTDVSSETCTSCHPAIRAMGLRTSHHPVREGLMGCEDCHNPHDGSRPKMIRADWTNELCYQCHTEKRGPFLWEHGPVRENCLNCHNPHGSNHEKLLVAKQPYLCQRCHLNTRHPGTLYDGSNAGTTIAGSSNRAIEHACKNCHQFVHGGNAPSGPYLGR
jgi:DmsE family decaheme c-type cytochrome